MQTRSRSALGCGFASITRATTKPSSRARGVLDALDLEADARQRLDDLGERGLGVEVVFEPGEREFHICGPEQNKRQRRFMMKFRRQPPHPLSRYAVRIMLQAADACSMSSSIFERP